MRMIKTSKLLLQECKPKQNIVKIEFDEAKLAQTPRYSGSHVVSNT